jgi:hypothetical protein
MTKITFSILLIGIFKSSLCQIKTGWFYKEELISYMESPKDTIYIQDRKALEKVVGVQGNDSIINVNYKTNVNELILAKIETKRFIPSEHKVALPDTIYKFINNKKRVGHLIIKDSIDNYPAYGINATYPIREIKSLKINWGNTSLAIPKNAFHNLYEVHLSTTEIYITPDNSLLYIYISASDGAGGYAVKLIFNRSGYLSRIINRNECSDGFDFLDANANCE